MIFRKLLNRRIAAYQAELTRKYFEEVEGMFTKMRVWRHDYRQHIQTLKAHMQAGDYDAVSAYLDMLDIDLTRVDPALRTGNRMVDAILNAKITVARERGIEVKATAEVPVKLAIPEIELAAIIGNLIDNAVEACEKLPEGERLMRVYVDMKGAMLYICISNTAPKGKPTRRDRLFISTKGAGHGFGLKRVDELARRLNGYFNCAGEDGAFTAELLLPNS